MKSLERRVFVMSTRDDTGLKHELLGGWTWRRARHTPCPEFVAREREHQIATL